MIERLRRLLLKEFQQMLRDPRMRVLIFFMPVLQMVLFAFALTTDVTRVSLGVVDLDKTQTSRRLAESFTSSGWFRVEAYADSDRAMEREMDRGDVRAILRIPSQFEADIHGGRTAQVQVLADGSDSNTATIVFGYASRIVDAFAQEYQDQRLAARLGPGRSPAQVSFETRAWFNPNLESRLFYVPGLIGVMLLVVTMQLSALAVVREKEIGTIEQIMVTPITRLEFILGKTFPYLLVGYLILAVMFGIAAVLFDVRIHGSIPLLCLLTAIYLAGNLGIGLLISTTAVTQQQAMLTSFFVLMPCALLSGFIFPVSNMPGPVQILALFNPVRWYVDILRIVVIKGEGFSAALWPAVWQAGLAILFIAAAAARFKKTLA